jgi:copper chaperone
MYQFNVSDMTCGHCVSAVTKAVKGVDSRASVEISLAEKRVTVRSNLSQQEVAEAIKDAGYTPRFEA